MRLRPSDSFASERAAVTAASGAGPSSGDKTGQTGAFALVRQGAQRFKEHQYEAARVAFAQAYELDPLPGTLLNLGLAELSANHPVEAAQHLRKYLELPGQPREKNEAVTTTWLPRAEGQVSRIRVVNVRSGKVTLTESSIEIWVDGTLMHDDPYLGEIEVAAGDHDVKVRAGTREQTMSHFAAPGGKVVTLQVQPFEDVAGPLQPRGRSGDARPRAEPLFGTSCDLGEGTLGPIARFESGEVVAYQIRSRRRRRLFVFPTLAVDDAFPVAVPGVRPRVQLLLELRTAGRIQLARSLFAYLVGTGRDPSALPDSFYTRVGAMLGGRLPGHKILLSLLSPSRQTPDRAFARTSASRQKACTANSKATPIDGVQGGAGSPRQARRRDA